MSKFQDYLLQAKEKAEAFLIDDQPRDSKTKDEYIQSAEEGAIVAFRLNFESKRGLKLTKVISGKIVENEQDQEVYVVETRNNLKYVVPYSSVVWVKTGGRWPKGVYDEMKQGSVLVDGQSADNDELGELETADHLDI